LRFADIDIDFYNKFKKWLLGDVYVEKETEFHYTKNYIGTVFKNISMFMNKSSKKKIHNFLGHKDEDFKVEKEEVDAIYLNVDELQKMHNLVFTEELLLNNGLHSPMSASDPFQTPTFISVPLLSTLPDAESMNEGLTEATGNSKRASGKQRKFALEEFRKQFMNAPKIENRKPVFASKTVRDDLERIVRLFGERGLSVSGLIENLSRNFLEIYRDDIEQWRKP
jgi:hypothetical protein